MHVDTRSLPHHLLIGLFLPLFNYLLTLVDQLTTDVRVYFYFLAFKTAIIFLFQKKYLFIAEVLENTTKNKRGYIKTYCNLII